jgi:hypothetical protein
VFSEVGIEYRLFTSLYIFNVNITFLFVKLLIGVRRAILAYSLAFFYPGIAGL